MDPMQEKIKEQILGEAAAMRVANRTMPVKGERVDLALSGRTVNVVYYRAGEENAPLFLCFHGGGFLFGGNAMDDRQWDYIRENLGVNVASVEYRKSPEFRWKEALDDAYDAACYLVNNAAEFGFDPGKVCVYGASAGANLAAAVCLYAKEKGGPEFYRQILMYPFLDCATEPGEKGEGGIDTPIMRIFNELHCEPEEVKNPLISPVFASRGQLRGLPEAVFVMADIDNLKHEGYLYAKQLAEAGVRTHVTSAPGMPHGFAENAFTDLDVDSLSFLTPEDRELVKSGAMMKEAEKALEFVRQCM